MWQGIPEARGLQANSRSFGVKVECHKRWPIHPALFITHVLHTALPCPISSPLLYTHVSMKAADNADAMGPF